MNGEYTLVKNPIVDFGYLTVTVDMATKPTLRIAFHDRTHTTVHDRVSVDLPSGKLT